MKKLLSLIIGLAVLATFAGLATVNAGDKATPPPTPNPERSVKSSKSNSSDRLTTTSSSRSNGSAITGKVSQVGNGTFTLTAKGKEYKFLLPKGAAQPKVGAVVDVTYTGTLGGAEALKGISVNSSKSNSSQY